MTPKLGLYFRSASAYGKRAMQSENEPLAHIGGKGNDETASVLVTPASSIKIEWPDR